MPDLTDKMVDAPTPAPFGVGAMGGQLRQMPTKLLLQLLQGQMEQRQDREQTSRQDEEKWSLIRSLPPEEQNDARLFGLQYVAQKRQRQAQQDAENQRQSISIASQQANAKAAAAARMQHDQGVQDKKKSDADWVLKNLMGGSPQQRVPGMENFEAGQSGQDMRGLLATMQAGKSLPLPGGAGQMMSQMAGQGMQRVAGQNPMPNYNIIDPREEAILREAKVQIPPGFVGAQEFEQRQAQAIQAKKKTEGDQAKAQLETERQQAATDFVGSGGSTSEVMKAQAMMAMGMKPDAAFKAVEAGRSQKRREALAAKRTEDAAKAKADVTASKEAKDADRIAAEIVKIKKDLAATVPATLPGGVKDPKNSVSKLNKEQRDILLQHLAEREARLDELRGKTPKVAPGAGAVLPPPKYSGSGDEQRHRDLLKKWQATGELSPDEQRELDSFEGL